LKNIANARDATNMLARRVKNTRARLAKKYIKISIDKLRGGESRTPKLINKRNIINGEEVIYLDDVGTEHFTFFIIPKSRILLV
jgi:hypothetical protein